MFISLQNKKTKECFWVFQPYFVEDDEFGVSVVLFPPIFYPVVLYNCSVRREDCSLCKNADQKYKCVWCDTTKSCIYKQLCSKELQQCPPPKITDVRIVFLAFLLLCSTFEVHTVHKIHCHTSNSKCIQEYLIGVTSAITNHYSRFKCSS